MFTLITFPWPVPSANAPVIAVSTRAVPQPEEAEQSVTAGQTDQRISLVAPKV